MRRVILELVAVLLLPLWSHAQPQVVPQPEAKVTVSLHTGVLTLLTRGEKGEYFAARAALNAELSAAFAMFARADLTGMQDGGSIDYTDPSTFRSIESAAGVKLAISDVFSLACLGGVTWSAEGDEGAPADPRLYTAACGPRLRLGDAGGYVYLMGGHHGPVGGGAVLLSAVLPLGDGDAATFVDFALPFAANALQEKTWTLKLGGAVRVFRRGL